jgi:hypothetical protein
MRFAISILLLCIALPGSAESTEQYDGNLNFVIGYLPPMTQKELDDPMSGAASAIDHIEWAIFKTVECLQQSGITAIPKETFTREITIKTVSGPKAFKLPIGWPQEAGLVLIKAGHEPKVVPSQAGPSSLLLLGPEAAYEYFQASRCREDA